MREEARPSLVNLADTPGRLIFISICSWGLTPLPLCFVKEPSEHFQGSCPSLILFPSQTEQKRSCADIDEGSSLQQKECDKQLEGNQLKTAKAVSEVMIHLCCYVPKWLGAFENSTLNLK